MQADKKEPAAAPAAAPAPATAAGKPPSICDRLQKAFHARPAFRPLRRLTVRHEDGGAGAAKPAGGAGDGGATGAAPAPAPAAKHSGPPLPALPRPLTQPPAPKAEQPVPVRLPAVTSKVAAGSAPTGPPMPVPPPDVVAGMAAATPADDAKAGDEGQQSKGKTKVGSRVRKAFSSKRSEQSGI